MLENQQLAATYQFGGQDLPTLLAHWAIHRGDKIFLIWEPKAGTVQRWTYAQFWYEVRRVAAGLHGRGIAKGDRVLIHSDNCPEMVFA
ncbi:AMP dependent CoA ligase, putative, partial [Ricinus communis]